jgi:hypothetical protein
MNGGATLTRNPSMVFRWSTFAIGAARRAVPEVELGPAALDQPTAFGAHDEDLEAGDEGTMRIEPHGHRRQAERRMRPGLR